MKMLQYASVVSTMHTDYSDFVGSNDINAKYDASYRNSENTNRLMGLAITLGTACGIVGVALFGADIPLEAAGEYCTYFA
jgi:hypothetical protein